MGADLYIEPEYSNFNGDKYSGNCPYYYRDSYNDSNLLWTVGLSYWNDIQSLINKKQEMSPANCKKFLTMFDEAKAKGQKLPDWPDETPQKVQKYFDEKEKQFKEFFMLAIRTKRKVYFSV